MSFKREEWESFTKIQQLNWKANYCQRKIGTMTARNAENAIIIVIKFTVNCCLDDRADEGGVEHKINWNMLRKMDRTMSNRQATINCNMRRFDWTKDRACSKLIACIRSGAAFLHGIQCVQSKTRFTGSHDKLCHIFGAKMCFVCSRYREPE